VGEGVPELSRHTRVRLERIADRALADAGALGVLPTPLEAVQRAAGIVERRGIEELPPGLVAGDRPLLGALWFERRTVYVDRSQPPARRRFTDAHEAMHALCPWHVAVLREDTEDELFRPARLAVEAEANHGAGLLIFQGSRFRRAVARERCTIAAAQALAEQHAASLQATLHQFVQQHHGEVALVVTGRFPRRDGALPVWSGTQSPAFRRRHGPVAGHVGSCVPAATPLRDAIEAARVGAAAPPRPLPVGNPRREGERFAVEAFYNRHTFLVLLSSRASAPASRAVSAARCA
jgi:hypothetical protein